MAELSRRGGITKSQLSKVVAGDRRPGPGTCRAIARAFHLPMEDVFHRAGLLPRSRRVNDYEEELWHYYSQLNEDDQQRLLLIARALYGSEQEKR